MIRLEIQICTGYVTNGYTPFKILAVYFTRLFYAVLRHFAEFADIPPPIIAATSEWNKQKCPTPNNRCYFREKQTKIAQVSHTFPKVNFKS